MTKEQIEAVEYYPAGDPPYHFKKVTVDHPQQNVDSLTKIDGSWYIKVILERYSTRQMQVEKLDEYNRIQMNLRANTDIKDRY